MVGGEGQINNAQEDKGDREQLQAYRGHLYIAKSERESGCNLGGLCANRVRVWVAHFQHYGLNADEGR
jgi:hypothetical protein